MEVFKTVKNHPGDVVNLPRNVWASKFCLQANKLCILVLLLAPVGKSVFEKKILSQCAWCCFSQALNAIYMLIAIL